MDKRKEPTAKPSEILQSIADVLLGNPEAHTKDEEARDSSGRQIPSYHEDACQWCALGFLNVATYDIGGDSYDTVAKSIYYFKTANNIKYVANFNDNPSQKVSRIQKAFQKAADLAAKKGE